MSEGTKKPIYKTLWFWVGIVVVVGIIGSQAGKKDAPASGAPSTTESTASTGTAPEKPVETAVKISATDLYESYKSNEISANERFKGKTLEVTGEVENVDETLGSYYVHLKADEILGQVSCKLRDKGQAASLAAGQMVTVVGKGDGKLGFPRVTDCVVK